MSFRDWFKLLAFFSLVFMTGCQNRSSLEADPQIDLPCDWKEQQSAEDITLDRWWETFDDCQLNELEELAISFNKTTAVATQRLRKLYYQARVNFGALFPEVNLSPGFFKQGSVAAGFPGAIIDQDLAEGPAENVDVLPVENNNGPPATGNIVGQNRNVFTNITVPLNFRWQLDLWGKLSNRYLAAFYQFQSSYFDLSQTLNQVTTDVAVNYFLLRGLVSEEVILRKIIAVRLEALQINQARYEAGLSFYLDVTRAEVDLNSAKSELEDVLRRQALQQNLLAVLTGHYAADFELQAASLPQLLQPPDIPVILPAKLLVRRPDIFARLALIKSANASLKVANAEFYPDIAISAAIGYTSNSFGELFNWHTRLWQIAASAFQPIFEGGRLCANYQEKKAAYFERVEGYFENVVTAVAEVEDVLNNIKRRQAQEDFLNQTALAALETYKLAKIRYDSGLINYLDVVIAERDLLSSTRAAASVHAQRFVDEVLLIKALGGGWSDCPADAER